MKNNHTLLTSIISTLLLAMGSTNAAARLDPTVQNVAVSHLAAAPSGTEAAPICEIPCALATPAPICEIPCAVATPAPICEIPCAVAPRA